MRQAGSAACLQASALPPMHDAFTNRSVLFDSSSCMVFVLHGCSCTWWHRKLPFQACSCIMPWISKPTCGTARAALDLLGFCSPSVGRATRHQGHHAHRVGAANAQPHRRQCTWRHWRACCRVVKAVVQGMTRQQKVQRAHCTCASVQGRRWHLRLIRHGNDADTV